MRRLTMTLLVTVGLWGGYRLYARLMARLTTAPAAPPVAAIDPPSAAVNPPNFAKVNQFLDDARWTERAAFKIKHADNAFLYFDRYEPHGPRVSVEPFALVWNPPGETESVPYVFRCERARMTFERDFQLGGESPGRLIGVALDGVVFVTGPDGLVLEGRDCVFSEDEHQLYSDHHCKFTYRPSGETLQVVSGEADQLQVDLTPVTYPALGRDLPRVAESPERITLRKNVSMVFQTLEKEGLRNTKIVSRGPFVYDFSQRLATFQDDVQVIRPILQPDGGKLIDSLSCAWLAVQFEETNAEIAIAPPATVAAAEPPSTDALADAPAESGPSLGSLRFRILRAMGNANTTVQLTSEPARLTGTMRDLVYDAVQRVLVMQDAVEGVELEHDGATLRTPALRLNHDPEFNVTYAEGLRAGRLDFFRPGPDNSPPQVFHALWDKQLTLQPYPERNEIVVTLEGEARVIQPGEQGILCDRLTLWIEAEGMRGLRENAPASSVELPGAAAPPTRKIPLKRALAEGNVAMASRQFQLSKTDRLDVLFESGAIVGLDANPSFQTRLRRRRPPQQFETSLAGDPQAREAPVFPSPGIAFTGPPLPVEELESLMGEQPRPERPRLGRLLAQAPLGLRNSEDSWEVQARHVDALLLQNPETGQVDVRELVGQGKVVVLQKPQVHAGPAVRGPDEEPLSVTGEWLNLLNQGGFDQTLHLTGAPAHLRRAGMHIEGDELFFDRIANTAKVIGKGMMQLPMKQDATGEPLETPSQLDLHWLREMVFDGAQAHFIEGVRARLQDSVMRCDEMHVTFNRRVNFASEHPDTEGLAIQNVDCLHGVDVEFYQWVEQQITAVAKGRATEFHLQYDTGDFEALGPGHLDAWQEGEDARVDVSSRSVARANQPATTDKLPWQFTNVRFAGKLTGNLHRKHGTLTDRVRVTYAPVAEPLAVFVRDDLSRETESSKNAVWLGCDELQISLHPWEGKDRDYVQLLAVRKRARVELEGRLFQANSDTLSFNELTNLFTLRGLGGNKASISTQDHPGAPYQDHSSQSLQFNPETKSLSIQGSDGATFSQ